MNVLYLGRYKTRFTPIINYLKVLPQGSQVLELCFGDTQIAAFCRNKKLKWKGIDLNKNFISHAQTLGYDAYYGDISTLETLPKADVCIMMGSLYHFHPETSSMLAKMLKASNIVAISEPTSNLSSHGGLIGFLAKRAANVGNGVEEFRYETTTLLAMLKANSEGLNYEIVSTQHKGKDLIVFLKNGNN